MNKHKQIDQTQLVTFELSTPELPSFTIEGSFEDVAPIYEDFAAHMSTRVPRAPRQAPAAVTAAKAATEALFSRVRTDVSAKLYDLTNDTHFYEAVREKRQVEKDLRMAQRLGLLTISTCAKHRKAIEDVKKVR